MGLRFFSVEKRPDFSILINAEFENSEVMTISRLSITLVVSEKCYGQNH